MNLWVFELPDQTYWFSFGLFIYYSFDLYPTIKCPICEIRVKKWTAEHHKSIESHSGTDRLAYILLLVLLYSAYCELSLVALLSTLPTLKSGRVSFGHNPPASFQIKKVKKASAGEKGWVKRTHHVWWSQEDRVEGIHPGDMNLGRLWYTAGLASVWSFRSSCIWRTATWIAEGGGVFVFWRPVWKKSHNTHDRKRWIFSRVVVGIITNSPLTLFWIRIGRNVTQIEEPPPPPNKKQNKTTNFI